MNACATWGVGDGGGLLLGSVVGGVAQTGGLASRVSRVAKRFFGVPEFHYYASADGISVLLSRLGVWCPFVSFFTGSDCRKPTTPFRLHLKTGESPNHLCFTTAGTRGI